MNKFTKSNRLHVHVHKLGLQFTAKSEKGNLKYPCKIIKVMTNQ